MKLNKQKKQFVNLPPHPGNRGNMTHHTPLCLTFSFPGTSLSSGCRCPRPPLWIIAHLCFTVCMCFCYQNLYIYSDSFANRMVPVPLGGTFFLGGVVSQWRAMLPIHHAQSTEKPLTRDDYQRRSPTARHWPWCVTALRQRFRPVTKGREREWD